MKDRIRLLLEFRFPVEEISTKEGRLATAKQVINSHDGEIIGEKEWVKDNGTVVSEIYLMIQANVVLYQKSTFESILLREFIKYGRGCGASALLEV